MVVYSFFVLAGQSVGALLGGVYFDKGGNSTWMATLVQVAGFPVLFPFQWFTKHKKIDSELAITKKPSHPLVLALVYLCLGIFVAANCMLYSIGLQYLPITTYTLICASQLGFNALFSYFLNRQKFTPYIVNSLVLLTTSSVLLVFQKDPEESKKSSGHNYVIGFLSTLGASAGCGLMLPVTQLAFQKIIKKETLRAVLDMTIYQCVFATLVIVIGLFGSEQWKTLDKEINEYELGKVSYVMNLFWTAVAWQTFNVGCIGLIFKISSLFSNVISIFGLPLAPVLSVIFMYQHYLDHLEMKRRKGTSDVEQVSVTDQRAG